MEPHRVDFNNSSVKENIDDESSMFIQANLAKNANNAKSSNNNKQNRRDHIQSVSDWNENDV